MEQIVADSTNPKRSRKRFPQDVQVRVFHRDGWICRWCGRPVIFQLALKYLERLARQRGHNGPLAYFHSNWTRQGAPLLDDLAAVIDHIEAFSPGGADDKSNLVTACNKCNMRKSNAPAGVFSRRSPRRPTRSKYGEPTDWDGLSTLFILLVEQDESVPTTSEKGWYNALRKAVPGR
jgi:5-methylcytosine-specific restriction endonuclease McrA